MRTSRRGPLVLSLLVLALVALSVMPAAGKGPGGGNGGGGGGGGGKGETYSDLVIAYRDADGVPILAAFTYFDEEVGESVTDHCVRPVYYGDLGLDQTLTTTPADDGTWYRENPANGEMVTLIPLVGDEALEVAVTSVTPQAEDETELEVCDPDPRWADPELGYILEAELERLNSARSPDRVVDRQLGEVEAMLADADGEMSLEASGRLRIGGVTVDSPLMNLAIYKELMRTGVAELTDSDGVAHPLPEPVSGYGWLHHATVAFAMSGGKEVPISIDELLYFNRTARIMADFAGATVLLAETGETFVDYATITYPYDRATTFSGCVSYWPEYGYPTPITQPILAAVFGDEPPPELDTAVEAAARHADDARRVNLWFHDRETALLDWDAPGEDTCRDQYAVYSAPSVEWSVVPAEFVQGTPATVSTTATNPVGDYPDSDYTWAPVRFQVLVDADADFSAAEQVTVVATDGQSVPFAVDANGDLQGVWGPEGGFPMEPGTVTTDFTVTIAEGAPTGSYTLSLSLVDLYEPPASWSPAVDTATTIVALPVPPS